MSTGYNAKLTINGIASSMGIPPQISIEPNASNYSTYAAPAVEFSAEVFLTEAGKTMVRNLYCQNFDGFYDGIQHVYSTMLREWMPIGYPGCR